MFETLALTLVIYGIHGAGAAPPAQTEQLTPPPYVGVWVVEIVDNVKVMPDSKITMRIDGETIAGIASCNNYRGSFATDSTSVKVGELLRTMKTCDAARLSEENDFLTLLRQVVRYEVQSRDSLELKTSDGKTIVARREQ